MTAGEQVMLQLYADNWDSLPQVIKLMVHG